MGSLIDRDDLITNLQIKLVGAYESEAAMRIISGAPAIKAYPERTAQIVRRMFGKECAKYVCNSCENAIPDHVIPAKIRFCWKCGARITGVQDATK